MRTLPFALLGLALLAGCGKSPSAAPPPASGPSAALAGATPTSSPASMPATADVCGLLTKAEVEAATGVKVGEVIALKPEAGQQGKCEYRHADASYGTVPVAAVTISDKVEADKQTWSQVMKTTPVEGIGDYAYLFTGFGPSLFVGKGGKAILVSLYDGGPPEKRQAEIKALATAALARL